jgi:preprotein translocase subunit SecG
MSIFLTVIHVITCVILVIVVLLQAGKGAEISASFGGSSQTVFGSSGGANFFVKFTYTLAGIFTATSLTLTILGAESRKSLFEGMAPAPISKTAPPLGAPQAPNTAPAAPQQGAAQPPAAAQH